MKSSGWTGAYTKQALESQGGSPTEQRSAVLDMQNCQGSPGKPGCGHPNPEHNVWSSLATSRRAGFLPVALKISCCGTHNHYLCLLFPFQMFDWISHNKELFLQSHTEIGVSYQHALDLQTQHNHFAMNSMVSAGPVFLGQENDEEERGWDTEGRNGLPT